MLGNRRSGGLQIVSSGIIVEGAGEMREATSKASVESATLNRTGFR